MKILVKNGIYIKSRYVGPDQLEEFKKQIYVQETCDRCDIYRNDQRPSETCLACPGFTGDAELYSFIPSRDAYCFPMGLRTKVAKVFSLNKNTIVLDERTTPPMRKQYSLTQKLWGPRDRLNQIDIVNTAYKSLLESKTGILEALPRSGKTVMATSIAIRLKLKTLVLVHTDILADQFRKEVLAFTNIDPKDPLGVSNKNYAADIVITTYQKFRNEKNMRQIKNLFGLLIVDECHFAGANVFSEVVHQMSCKYKLGLTGTVRRKDGKEVIMEAILGKVIAKSEVAALTPIYRVRQTSYVTSAKVDYVRFCTDLSINIKRNKDICEDVFNILRANKKHRILITSIRVAHCDNLEKLINKRALELNNEGKGDYKVPIAKVVTGKTPEKQRLAIMEEAKSGKLLVLIAIRTKMSYGVNIPAWTHLLRVSPSASRIKPDPAFQQETQRVCTPYPNGTPKPTPQIWEYIDGPHSLSAGCLKSNLLKSARPLGYRIDKSCWEAINANNQTKTHQQAFTFL